MLMSDHATAKSAYDHVQHVAAEQLQGKGLKISDNRNALSVQADNFSPATLI
jgi:hypothetical protein